VVLGFRLNALLLYDANANKVLLRDEINHLKINRIEQSALPTGSSCPFNIRVISKAK